MVLTEIHLQICKYNQAGYTNSETPVIKCLKICCVEILPKAAMINALKDTQRPVRTSELIENLDTWKSVHINMALKCTIEKNLVKLYFL